MMDFCTAYRKTCYDLPGSILLNIDASFGKHPIRIGQFAVVDMCIRSTNDANVVALAVRDQSMTDCQTLAGNQTSRTRTVDINSIYISSFIVI